MKFNFKNLFSIYLASSFMFGAHAQTDLLSQPLPLPPSKSPTLFYSKNLHIAEFIQNFFDNFRGESNYSISQAVRTLDVSVSLNLTGMNRIESFEAFKNILAFHNISLTERNQIFFVDVVKDVDHEPFVYFSKFRPVQDLINDVQFLFRVGKFSTSRQISSSDSFTSESTSTPGSAKSLISTNASDFFVFSGPPNEVHILRSILQKIDVAVPQVQITATVLEFSSSDQTQIGFRVASQILGSSGSVGLNSGALPQSNFASLTLGLGSLAFDSAIQNLQNDNRFRIVSQPFVSVASGQSAVFESGADVPVLGSVSVDKNGNAVQSINYMKSGLSFSVSPVVRDSEIHLRLVQDVSSFARTLTGVNDSPTRNRRTIETTLKASLDHTFLIGGLRSEATSDDSQRLFGVIPIGRGSSKSGTEILILIHVVKL